MVPDEDIDIQEGTLSELNALIESTDTTITPDEDIDIEDGAVNDLNALIESTDATTTPDRSQNILWIHHFSNGPSFHISHVYQRSKKPT